MEQEIDQIGTEQTAEELRWKTDVIASGMLHREDKNLNQVHNYEIKHAYFIGKGKL